MRVGVVALYPLRYVSKTEHTLAKQHVGCEKDKAGITVAKVIEFYIPSSFRKPVKWVSSEQRGKIIEFAPIQKSA